jgi:hypothetical protein
MEGGFLNLFWKVYFMKLFLEKLSIILFKYKKNILISKILIKLKIII